MREVIATDLAPKAIGPYSQAIRAQGLIFTSGQVAIDPANQQVIAGDVSVQTARVLKNLDAILQASGSSLEKVLRCTVFLKNMGDFAAMNEVYGQYFKQAPPALPLKWRGFRKMCWLKLMRSRWFERNCGGRPAGAPVDRSLSENWKKGSI